MTPMKLTYIDKLDSPEASHLALLRKGDHAIVTGMATSHAPEQIATRTRLLELGFAPGEKIRVVAVSFPKGDPMAVRLGNTTFALRRHEAALVQVERLHPAAN